ncbi:hypothetical protein F5888DRAFT_823490 [Russula emetica]|nr:hypothetical protein F5888DRAFT_823490 [Russula emetica]
MTEVPFKDDSSVLIGSGKITIGPWPLNKSLTPLFISLSTLFLLRTRSHLSMSTVLPVVLSLFALFLVQFLLELRRVTRNVGNLPGPFLLFDLHSAPGHLIARLTRPIPYINPGTTWMLSKKYEVRCCWTGRCFSGDILRNFWERMQTQSDGSGPQTTAFPQPKTNLYVADAEANKAIITSRAKFPKDVNHYAVLGVFGPSVVVSEGEEWKKYRKIVAPAFSERNNKLVWDETTRIMTDLFNNVWGDKSEIVVDHCVDITLPHRWVRPSDHMDD